MDSAQPGSSGVTGPVTRKRRQLEVQEEKRRAKEEMKKKVRKNTKTSFIQFDKSTRKVKIEVKQEPEVEQIVVFVKEEVEVPMDNAGDGEEEKEVLGGTPVAFQESIGAEAILKECPMVPVDQPIKAEGEASEGEPMFWSISEVHSVKALASQVPTASVAVGTAVLGSHYVPLEEFNKLKAEMRLQKEESDKRFSALEAGFHALQRKLEGNSTLTPIGDQTVDSLDMEEEPGSASMDTEEHSMEEETAAKDAENSTEPEDDRTLTLFPEVIEVIWEKYKYSMFNKADFLKSRLVCSTWEQGINKLIIGPCQCVKEKREITLFMSQFLWKDRQEREFQYDPDSGIILDSPVQPTKLTIEDYQNGYEELEEEEEELEESAKCRKSIEDFLKKHGHSIKEFICGLVKDSPHFENKEDMQRTLIRWLNLMPNLEKVGYSNWLEHDDNGLLALDQFPTLPKLKFLCEINLPHALFRSAVLNNPQISSLRVHGTRQFNFKNVSLPGLKELKFDYYPYDLTLVLMQELHATLLEKLRLGTLHWRYPGQAEAVYEVLNKFRESLQVLEIYMELKPGEVVFPDMLRLRKLVYVFGVYSRDFCMDDFDRAIEDLVRIISSSCPSLEHLVLGSPIDPCWGEEKPRRRKRVQAQLFSKLKFWEAFPSLKKVESMYLFRVGLASLAPAFVFIQKL